MSSRFSLVRRGGLDLDPYTESTQLIRFEIPIKPTKAVETGQARLVGYNFGYTDPPQTGAA